ncbi:LacI family DNA-binding transcriptional regulator [Nonomuraea sp. CA-141351]|uniref:LacI family DNA-binding transcriptional regulator n=1 Tax=Nonomuraea sp. CA-141351 TaxID=3239996 RepID=UPI003D8A682A
MSRERTKPATVTDVARLAGVSPGTVSKALNGRGQLAAATRERVMSAARELGFNPNLVARGLVSGRTYLVGVLTTDTIGRFTIPLLTGAEDVLGPGQMSMLLCESRGDPIREQHYIRSLLNRRVDGVIVTGRNSDVRPSLGAEVPIPVIYALVQSDDPRDTSVLHDDREGAAVAVRHLVETGRRRIAHVTGPGRHAAVKRRLLGVEDALRAEGVSLIDEPMYGEWSEAWGREAAFRLDRGGKEFDGVFCASDQIARGLVDGLREAGRQVPEEVGVVGMDNWDAMAEAARPPLTTVDLNLSGLGRTAAELLVAMINGRPIETGHHLVPSSLVKRRSTELS